MRAIACTLLALVLAGCGSIPHAQSPQPNEVGYGDYARGEDVANAKNALTLDDLSIADLKKQVVIDGLKNKIAYADAVEASKEAKLNPTAKGSDGCGCNGGCSVADNTCQSYIVQQPIQQISVQATQDVKAGCLIEVSFDGSESRMMGVVCPDNN